MPNHLLQLIIQLLKRMVHMVLTLWQWLCYVTCLSGCWDMPGYARSGQAMCMYAEKIPTPAKSRRQPRRLPLRADVCGHLLFFMPILQGFVVWIATSCTPHVTKTWFPRKWWPTQGWGWPAAETNGPAGSAVSSSAQKAAWPNCWQEETQS